MRGRRLLRLDGKRDFETTAWSCVSFPVCRSRKGFSHIRLRLTDPFSGNPITEELAGFSFACLAIHPPAHLDVLFSLKVVTRMHQRGMTDEPRPAKRIGEDQHWPLAINSITVAPDPNSFLP